MRAMNDSFVSMQKALDHALTREGEFQSLQTRLEEREGHNKQLEVLKGVKTNIFALIIFYWQPL